MKRKSTAKKAPLKPVVIVEEKKAFSHEKLMKALYFMYDLFSRANMPFFLLDETAKYARENKLMEGDHITCGIRAVDFQTRSLGILEAFQHADSIENNEIRYTVEGVPVTVKIIKSSEPMFTNPDTFMYQYEFFSIPNPFSLYWKNRQKYEQ